MTFTMTPPTQQPKASKTDAGNGWYAIFRVIDASRSPSPDPKRSPQKAMRSLVTLLFVLLGSHAMAGDPPEVLFKLGSWDFQLSTVGNPEGGVDSLLVARHKTDKGPVVGFSRLDPRVCFTARNIIERDGKLGRAASEVIVDLAGPHWTSGETVASFPAGSAPTAARLETFMALLRSNPPTEGYKKSFDYITRRVTPRTTQGEQGGTGQPATRRQSKPGGSDQPQPESEGRSR